MASARDMPASFNNFQPVVTKRASEVIYEQVRSLIISGELKPKDRLPSERKMMEMFQRSRPTIREALRMLERSGYIHIVAGSNGAVVTEPNGNNVQDVIEDALQTSAISLSEISEYRKVSECGTAVWAAQRRTDEDMVALKDALQQMGSCIGDYEKFIGWDIQFHELLAIAAKNQVSVLMNRTLSKFNRSVIMAKMERSTPLKRRQLCKRIHELHQEILAAVAAGDPEKARLAMESHLVAFETD
jgi:GntR family transcriptional repressor for pyruvate dehydrogenase complex